MGKSAFFDVVAVGGGGGGDFPLRFSLESNANENFESKQQQMLNRIICLVSIYSWDMYTLRYWRHCKHYIHSRNA